MFWGSRTSSYNVVTFWLKLASTFYALFLFILWYHGVMIRQPCYLLKLFCFYHTRLKVLFFHHCLQTSLLHIISLRPLRGVDVTASVGGPQVFLPVFR